MPDTDEFELQEPADWDGSEVAQFLGVALAGFALRRRQERASDGRRW